MIFRTGVIIGRFQSPILHDGHLTLINKVVSENEFLIVVLGDAPAKFTNVNPIPVSNLKESIIDQLKGIGIPYVVTSQEDKREDKTWSVEIDNEINRLAEGTKVTLYGSRDSFIPYYKGRFPTKYVDMEITYSSTQIRNEIKDKTKDHSYGFLSGIIYATQNKFPTAYPTVDVAILKPSQAPEDDIYLLLGKKPGVSTYCFIGGFVDPTDSCLEVAGGREVSEEVPGIDIHELSYVSSRLIDDWRYRRSNDRIMTTFFKTWILSGAPKKSEELEETKWFSIKHFDISILGKDHQILFNDLKRNLGL